MLRLHRHKFIFRSLVMVMAFSLTFLNPQQLEQIFFFDFGYFRLYHALWFLMMLGMLQVFFPSLIIMFPAAGTWPSIFSRQAFPIPNPSLKMPFGKTTGGALRSAFFWGFLLAVIGLLRYAGIIGSREIHLLVVFFCFADEFCIKVGVPSGPGSSAIYAAPPAVFLTGAIL